MARRFLRRFGELLGKKPLISTFSSSDFRRGHPCAANFSGCDATCLVTACPKTWTRFPGNYIFLDATALRLGICSPDDLAMSVIASVVFRNGRYAIIDAGTKAMSSDLGPHGTGGWGFEIVARADNDDRSVGALRRCPRNMASYRATGLTCQWALDCASSQTIRAPLRRFSISTDRRMVPVTLRKRPSMRAAAFASDLFYCNINTHFVRPLLPQQPCSC